jgi:hypothetical protein
MRVGILVALLLALAFPVGAAASPYARYGLQDDAWIRQGPGTLEQRLDRLEDLGVDLVRMNVLWSEIERKRGTYDWSAYDPVIRGLNERGIEPVLTLLGTPAWANGGRGTNWAPNSGAPFGRFARRAAGRYAFVRRWLVWNEPNQRDWLRPTTPKVYVKRLLNPAYAAIHAVRTNTLVAGGVTAPRAATGGVSPVAWIRGMAAAGAQLDAYAHNPYPLTRSETPFTGGCDHCRTITMATLPRLLASTRAFGPGTRIWLTEYGNQTNPPDFLFGISKLKQARYTSEAALRAYLMPRVDMLVNFLVQDEPDLERWQSGVMTVRGWRKPSYGAFRMPLAVRAQSGLKTTLWGQIRPGRGAQRYRIEQLRNGGWHVVGGNRRTNRFGFLSRVVRAGPGAKLRVVHLPTQSASSVLVVE